MIATEYYFFLFIGIGLSDNIAPFLFIAEGWRGKNERCRGVVKERRRYHVQKLDRLQRYGA